MRQAYGQVFNIGGGIENSLSLLELFDMLERKLNIKMIYTNYLGEKVIRKVFCSRYTKGI